MKTSSRMVLSLISGVALAGLLSGCGLLEIFGRGLSELCDVDTYVVNKTEDTNDGVCTADDCSLREAVITANACGGEHAIELPAGIYPLTVAGTREDEAATGDLDLTADITLVGVNSIVDGNGLDTVFHVLEPAAVEITSVIVQGANGAGILTESELRLQHVTIRDNDGPGLLISDRPASADLDNVTIERNRGEYGGGIVLSFTGQMTIRSAVISENYASAQGGGIWMQAGSLAQISGLTLEENRADDAGGGMFSYGRVFMIGSQVRGNQGGGVHFAVIDVAGGGTTRESVEIAETTFSNNAGLAIRNDGADIDLIRVRIRENDAGIRNDGEMSIQTSQISANRESGVTNLGQLTIEDTTIDANRSSVGGGIYSRGETLVERTTISNNTADNFGAGVFVGGGSLRVVNSTVSGNRAGLGGGGIAYASEEGGTPPERIELEDSTVADNSPGGLLGEVSLLRTIVAGNTERDCSQRMDSRGYNLDQDGSCGLTEPGDLSGVDPLLRALADNGGETLTHALVPESPAVNAAGTICAATDQRGVVRPDGPACDIGAFEYTIVLAVGTPDPFSSAVPIAQPKGPTTCRSGPSVVYPPLAYFDIGQELVLQSRNGNGTWLEIQLEGERPCWSNKDLLELDPGFNVMDLPLGFIPPTPTWTIVPPTEPSDAGPQGCWHQGPNDNQPICYVPCPPQPNPGGACTP